MGQVAMMLSGSFFFTVAMLAYTLNNMVRAREVKVPLEEAMKNPLVAPLAFAAVVMAVLSFVIKKVLSPKPDPSQALRARMANAESEADPARLSRFFTAHLVSYALSEGVAILGFVLGMNTGSMELALPFFAAGLILFAIHWPRPNSWK